jgi:hypothetical protein
MTNLVTFAGANLPAVASLATSLRSIATEVGPTGSVILKMDKTGHWVFGADQTEVEDDALWAVNPFSFVHGFIAWGDGEVLGEKMAPAAEPLPEVGPAPSAAKRGWETQIGMSLKCIKGEDAGLEVRYNVTSVGGKRAVQELAFAIATQVHADQTKPVPVVRLKKEHYQHKSYGRIYTPIFDIVEFVSMDAAPDAQSDAQADGEVEAVQESTPGRRRRSV